MYSGKNGHGLREVCSPWAYEPEDGEVAGIHRGAHFFTIGQRKGMNVGGKKEPLFVIATDTGKNIVYTGQGQSHPGLYRSGLFIRNENIHWIRPGMEMAPGETRNYLTRIRYRQSLQQSVLTMRGEGLYITFGNPQRGIAAGQFAAWYDGEEVMGSGVIEE